MSIKTVLGPAIESDPLFIGIFPGGISYADRTVERDGDYKRLAFLPYDTLALQVQKDCPPELRHRIVEMRRRSRRAAVSHFGSPPAIRR